VGDIVGVDEDVGVVVPDVGEAGARKLGTGTVVWPFILMLVAFEITIAQPRIPIIMSVMTRDA